MYRVSNNGIKFTFPGNGVHFAFFLRFYINLISFSLNNDINKDANGETYPI